MGPVTGAAHTMPRHPGRPHAEDDGKGAPASPREPSRPLTAGSPALAFP